MQYIRKFIKKNIEPGVYIKRILCNKRITDNTPILLKIYIIKTRVKLVARLAKVRVPAIDEWFKYYKANFYLIFSKFLY